MIIYSQMMLDHYHYPMSRLHYIARNKQRMKCVRCCCFFFFFFWGGGGLIYVYHAYCIRVGSRARVQGVLSPPPPPEMTCGFLIQLVFCKKIKKRHLRHSLVVYPFLRKILDPPLCIDLLNTKN